MKKKTCPRFYFSGVFFAKSGIIAFKQTILLYIISHLSKNDLGFGVKIANSIKMFC